MGLRPACVTRNVKARPLGRGSAPLPSNAAKAMWGVFAKKKRDAAAEAAAAAAVTSPLAVDAPAERTSSPPLVLDP